MTGLTFMNVVAQSKTLRQEYSIHQKTEQTDGQTVLIQQTIEVLISSWKVNNDFRSTNLV